jgi:hypothetical protein
LRLSSRTWISMTVIATLLGGGAVALANARQDLYGLFRDTHGRRLPIFGSERRGKYLLSHRYVPENFQAVLLGSSVTSNWNTGGITLVPTYNESTDGGNISEEKLLAETVLRSPGLRLAICVIHPYLTDSHGLNADEMKPSEYWGALGSISLLQSYKLRRTVARGGELLAWDAFGAEHKEEVDGLLPLNPVLRRLMKSPDPIQVDELALREYAELLAELRQRQVRLVAVIPPTLEELLVPRRDEMDRYARRVLALFTPEELVVDLESPEYRAFRLERKNFRDGVHLSARGADEVVRILDDRLRRARVLP